MARRLGDRGLAARGENEVQFSLLLQPFQVCQGESLGLGSGGLSPLSHSSLLVSGTIQAQAPTTARWQQTLLYFYCALLNHHLLFMASGSSFPFPIAILGSLKIKFDEP